MKKAIALISEHASPLASLGGVDSGGQNVYVGELARNLSMRGYQVDVFTRWDNEALPPKVTWIPDVRIVHIEAGPVATIEKEYLFDYMPEFTRKMLEFIQAEGVEYELIHANFWMSAMVASDIKKMLQIPFVVTFHALGYIRKIYQGDSDKFPSERIEIEKQVVKEADHIIAECPQDKDDLMMYYQAPQEKITIIPCGFNPHEFYPLDRLLARMVLKLDPKEFIVLQLGRMVPRKGIDNVIQAIAKLKKTATPVRLLVVGGESDDINTENNREIARLQKIARDAGVGDQVTFTGRKQRDVLKYYYAASDVFVTTPWYEPFGITPLESMACGTPVIGSNVGGIKYTVEDGVCGFLVPPNDSDALAARIFELLHDGSMRETMRSNAIRRVNTLFTWAKVTDLTIALYERVLTGSAVRRTADEESFKLIESAFDQAAEILMRAKKTLTVPALQAASILVNCFRKKGKVLICGNGGSAAESQHLAAELIGRFEIAVREGLPAISLTADSSVVTAWANDIGYADVFARQVDALGEKGDVLFCFSTSGESRNVINAMKTAIAKDMTCIALTGKGGGEMGLYAHVNMVVPSNNTQRVQELHLHILHTLCSLIEEKLFRKPVRPYLNGDGQLQGFNGKAGVKITDL
ncbi:MAG TPA: glycosyltransferase [Chryseosolibacter sp.]|nr:glycosyltransferase [Chryseosolibacter sp.]